MDNKNCVCNPKYNKIAMIGVGNVGATALYTMMVNELANEYVIIDANEKLAYGQFMDLEDALQGLKHKCSLKIGEYNDLKDADVVVITAGRNQRVGESRDGLIYDNAQIIKNIVENLNKINYQGLILLASNPLDVMVSVAVKYSNLKPNRILGSGTLLDSYRLRNLTGKKDSVVIGEHGDTSVSVVQEKKDGIDYNGLVRGRAGEIIKNKGYTAFGIGMALTEILKNIITEEPKDALPLSTWNNSSDVCTALPVYLDRTGVLSRSIPYNVDKETWNSFVSSTNKIKTNYDTLVAKLDSEK